MIKSLKSSDKIVRPFKTFKTWKLQNKEHPDSILLEQQQLVDEDETVLLDSVDCSLSIETQKFDSDLNFKYGKKIRGVFFPQGHKYHNSVEEPMNVDGTYYRTVYDSVKHLFYNDYNIQYEDNILDILGTSSRNIKNPLKLFGVESSEYADPSEVEDIDTGERYTGRPIERRVLGDVLTVVEVPRKMFGEKIKPNSVKMVDYSSEFEDISIVDDGYTNLITGEGIFNNIVKINFNEIRKIEAYKEPGSKFDARDLHFGYRLASNGKYFLSGAPMSHDTMSESQSGSAFLYKYDDDVNDFRLVRAFICPFTQNGLSIEQRQDHNGLLTKELDGILLDGNYSLNDNFGDAVELTQNECAMGASRAHIRGECVGDSTGHVFVYERNKGGREHWGLLNILEGLPNSDFGASISIDGDFMAVGSPALNDNCGVIYVFKKEKRSNCHPWWRLSDVPDSYEYNKETGMHEEQPPSGSGELKEINESTTRWKIKSVIPDGSILEAFYCDPPTGGSMASGSLSSGSMDSGSMDSGSMDSGSMDSGSGEYVAINPVEECELDCGEMLSTFGGMDIITQGIFPEDIENPSFDEGYRPHEYSDSPSYSQGDNTWVFDSQVMLKDTVSNTRLGEEVKLSNGHLYASTPSSDEQICYVFKRTMGECGPTWNNVYKISRGDYTTEVHDHTELKPDYISEDFKNIDIDVRGTEVKITIDPQRIEYDHWEWKIDSPLNKHSTTSNLRASGTAVVDRLYDVIEVDSGRHEIHIGFVDKDSHLVGSQSILMFTINPTISLISKRGESVRYPFEYDYGIRHRFGHSLEVTDKFLIIGDTHDRVYSDHGDNTYESGCVYVYSVGDEITFIEKLYGHETNETFFDDRFGSDISIIGQDFIVGAPCTDMSNIELVNGGEQIEVDDYYQGVTNNSDTFYYENGLPVNSVQGNVFYYRITPDDISLIKMIHSNKQKMSIRRNFGHAVSLSTDFIYVGLPVLGNFPITELETFDGGGMEALDSCDALVAEYEIDETRLHEQDLFLEGNVIAYDSGALMRGERSQVGNIFYKNGIVVLTSINTYLSSVMHGSGKTGFELEFKGTHTIYENEILCTVNPGEFNVSTNPTSLVYDDIPYDVNGDGVFDDADIRYIYKFLLGDNPRPSFTRDETEDVPGGIVLEQDGQWPNEDVLLVESEDVLLSSLVNDWEVGNTDVAYEKIINNLNKLKNAGLLDIDLDGNSNSRDGKLLLRYYLGKTATGLTRGLIDKYSERRTPAEIKAFLDDMTGKHNGSKIMECFTNYKKCDSLDKSGSYLAPFATTIGLYSGTDLVGVAKLGKAVKVVPNYPINFLIKFDG
jgi:hypothetical protein